ncbi:MAG: hypothetical protein JO115_11760 [Pseudonocardiales bacterium]|nr:hypothetical protein [Pseudonocardiales bacterium]
MTITTPPSWEYVPATGDDGHWCVWFLGHSHPMAIHHYPERAEGGAGRHDMTGHRVEHAVRSGDPPLIVWWLDAYS